MSMTRPFSHADQATPKPHIDLGGISKDCRTASCIPKNSVELSGSLSAACAHQYFPLGSATALPSSSEEEATLSWGCGGTMRPLGGWRFARLRLWLLEIVRWRAQPAAMTGRPLRALCGEMYDTKSPLVPVVFQTGTKVVSTFLGSSARDR
jgi:hypothetical protein